MLLIIDYTVIALLLLLILVMCTKGALYKPMNQPNSMERINTETSSGSFIADPKRILIGFISDRSVLYYMETPLIYLLSQNGILLDFAFLEDLGGPYEYYAPSKTMNYVLLGRLSDTPAGMIISLNESGDLFEFSQLSAEDVLSIFRDRSKYPCRDIGKVCKL